ncbi:hypothetical protein [Streptomyces sp. CA2R101]|uniref:hypothetical protein n=1 Tax=Streptomyces sp. CA2R101 TaxID=3120152 RepID=UPI00300AFCED
MTGRAKVVVTAAAVLCGLTAVGLTVVALTVYLGDAGGGPAGPVRAPGERSVAAGGSIGVADTGDEGGVA